MLVGVLGMAGPVLAFTPGACRQDAEKLCPGATDKEAVPCLKEHLVEVSTACKVNLAEARERVRQARDACEDDIKKLCATVEPGKGRILKCLKAHEPELSGGCRDKLAETKRKLLPDAPEEN